MSSDVARRTRQALGDLARSRGRRVDEYLQYYAMERFLYRLSQSDVRHTFILKGAMLLRAWDAPGHRPTRDIDFLGRMANDHDVIRSVVVEICNVEVPPDGVAYDLSQMKLEAIRANAVYTGMQVRFLAYVANSRCTMRLDIGFGDTPLDVQEIEFPTILDHPAPMLAAYPPESSIAEKYHALVALGMVNSRMKDFYDIWWLAGRFEFQGHALQEAVMSTFGARNTPLDPKPVGLTLEFATDRAKRAQWLGFVRRVGLEDAPELVEAVTVSAELLLPLTDRALKGEVFDRRWSTRGHWLDRE